MFADGPRLIGAVHALGRVARGESGPRCHKQKTAGSSERHHDVFHCDPPGLNYFLRLTTAQSTISYRALSWLDVRSLPYVGDGQNGQRGLKATLNYEGLKMIL